MRSTTTSARSMARMERSTLYRSMPRSTLPLRRMPAVSMSSVDQSLCTISVSSVSLVVPGISLTIARSSPAMVLSSRDLPTLGLPTMASFRSESGSGKAGSFGNRAITSAIISSMPMLW